ncbi:MAG: DUF3365 domain-containing protein [Gammaproteobacteria bacterium]
MVDQAINDAGQQGVAACPARLHATGAAGPRSGAPAASAAAVLALLCLAGAVPAEEEAPPDPRMAQGRELSTRLQQQLSGRLMAAMLESGAVNAIDVCRTEAPGIAAGLSSGAGARVWRTALKVRNPVNAPDLNARAVLEEFADELGTGTGAVPEHFAVAADGSARYMRAIVTQPPCLACHGAEIAAPVREAIQAHYPQDAATGFAAGDLRGAFVVDWPARSPAETP